MNKDDEIIAQQKELLEKFNSIFLVEGSEEPEIIVEPPLTTPELVAMCYNAFSMVSMVDDEEMDKLTQVALNRISRIKRNVFKIVDECLQAEAELLFDTNKENN